MSKPGVESFPSILPSPKHDSKKGLPFWREVIMIRPKKIIAERKDVETFLSYQVHVIDDVTNQVEMLIEHDYCPICDKKTFSVNLFNQKTKTISRIRVCHFCCKLFAFTGVYNPEDFYELFNKQRLQSLKREQRNSSDNKNKMKMENFIKKQF